jgi:hypothetical protein
MVVFFFLLDGYQFLFFKKKETDFDKLLVEKEQSLKQ